MKLERITLQNFRQYYGKHRLDFARDVERNVTLIHGVNGSGKTSLFLALNWCLYGRKAGDVKVIENVGKLLSKEASRLATTNERVSASVDLVFTHDGERYSVRRTLSGKKLGTGDIELDDHDDFIVMWTRADGQSLRVSNPIGTIGSILPANVREYFLFDGEKIDNFAKPAASEQVREAIYLVLNIEILERAQRHLDYWAREYRRKLKHVSNAKLREFVEQDESLRMERTTAEKRKAEIENEIQIAMEKISDIDVRLRALENARSLQERRDALEGELKLRRHELEQKVSSVQGLATNAYYSVGLPAIETALLVLDEKRKKGEIPSGIRQQFVEDLLDEMKCVCGRKITDNSPAHKQLMTLLDRSMPSSMEDKILDLNALLGTFYERSKEKQIALDVSMRERSQLVDIIEDREGQLDDLSRQLKDSPLEEISVLENKRREFEADIHEFKIDIGTQTANIEQLTENIKELDKKISHAKKEERKERLLSLQLDLAQQAADAIEEMHQTFADEMRKRIEAKTKEIFQQLVWKDTHFSDIRLDSDFHLEVYDRYGLPARPELSAGERQVLSISFIAAMAEISDEEAPLVIDTPFGRLSSHHRNSITKSLPRLADQLIIFVTDEELRGQAEENLRTHIGAEYRLNFDRDTSCTSIMEV